MHFVVSNELNFLSHLYGGERLIFLAGIVVGFLSHLYGGERSACPA